MTPPSARQTLGSRPAAAFPVAVLLSVAPTVPVLQFRALALIVTLGLVATVLLRRRRHGAWPWPRRDAGGAMAVGAVLALFAWLAVTAAWATEPWRAIGTTLRLGAFVLLGAATAQAVREEGPEGLDLIRRCLVVGLGVGIALALADFLSGHAIRAFVRGLRQVPPELVYGLKPAVSVSAAMLPLAVFLPRLPMPVRLALAVGGMASALLLPADAAKIATFVGLAAGLAAMALGAWPVRALAAGLAALILAAPLLCAALLARLPMLEAIPPSAAHRILIWDFAVERIAERPLLGWGGEASRTIPGGRDIFAPATLERFGLTSEASRAWFGRPVAQRLPLHTHNAALQLWMELGAVGALLGAAVAAALGWLAARVPRPILPAATGAYAAASVVGMLSYGVWQEWWIGLQILLVVALAGLAARARQDAAAPCSPRSSAR
jgi:O-antigen ligase